MDNYEALKNDIEKNINEMVNDLNLNVDSNNQMKNRVGGFAKNTLIFGENLLL